MPQRSPVSWHKNDLNEFRVVRHSDFEVGKKRAQVSDRYSVLSDTLRWGIKKEKVGSLHGKRSNLILKTDWNIKSLLTKFSAKVRGSTHSPDPLRFQRNFLFCDVILSQSAFGSHLWWLQTGCSSLRQGSSVTRPQRARQADSENREINTCSTKAHDWQRGALIHHDDGAPLKETEHPQ